MTILLDSHVLLWSSTDRARLSSTAIGAIDAADELAVASVTWYELAWLIEHGRITGIVQLSGWLEHVSGQVLTVPTTPAIAQTAVRLPVDFPKDPADRIIYATAVVNGWRLVTKDTALHRHRHPWPVALW